MNPSAVSYDLAPLASILAVGILFALAPIAWTGWRHRRGDAMQRRRALTWVTLFLTFDLVLFGAFTRLTDSGLGCPDWPGCYGHTSPLGASTHIDAAQARTPTGPVTHGKAWIEMTHRYVATGVGALIMTLAAWSWWARRRRRPGISPWLPSLTLLWVCLQGAFGAWTVTMKLYPAIVTLHLLGGIGLLVLLALQTQALEPRRLVLPPNVVALLWGVTALVLAQLTLGGWVSTNYAVLACRDFPTCQGSWWPAMDFARAFSPLRELGTDGEGAYLPFAALTAIHQVHRIGAAVVLVGLMVLAWTLVQAGPAARRWAWPLLGAGLWQVATGVSNAVLGWPLAAAIAHTGGAAALAVLLAVMLYRVRYGSARLARQRPAPLSASMAP